MLRRLDLRGVTDLVGRLPRPVVDGDEPTTAVREIVARVRAEGDLAVAELTSTFDGFDGPLRVPPAAIAAALESIDPETRAALQVAHDRIAAFHRHQLTKPTRYEDGGAVIESYAKPVSRVGCYVPGGRAAYPSTLLMTVVPAQVAGVEEVVVCVPAAPGTGEVAQVTLAAAGIAGVDELYAVGGAQAIAALAYGTECVQLVNPMVPATERGDFSLRLILHGRRVCFAKKPDCAHCVLAWMCPSSLV